MLFIPHICPVTYILLPLRKIPISNVLWASCIADCGSFFFFFKDNFTWGRSVCNQPSVSFDTLLLTVLSSGFWREVWPQATICSMNVENLPCSRH